MADSRKFRSEAELRRYYDEILEQLGKTDHTLSQQYVDGVLVENCLAHREWDTAKNRYLDFIREEGLSIETDPEMLGRVDLLFELRFLRKMIHAVGLSGYEQEIMQYEIENRFRKISGNPGIGPVVTRLRGGSR